MKKIWILLLLFATGCGHQTGEPDETIADARVPVTVVSVGTGTMTDYLDLTATSVFQIKSVVKSAVSGYVDEQLVNAGDVVQKSETLFRIRTKESASMRSDSTNSLMFSGLISVRASLDGMVISVDHPRGDYVQEGDQLAVVAVPSSLVFILDVPYETAGLIKTGTSCELILPGGESVAGHVKSALPAMNSSSQTQRYIIRPLTSQYEPENLIVRVRVVKSISRAATSLPKVCILSDELQQRFWVMKLINDSVAIKVPVMPGLHTSDRVEITSPVFNSTDKFLASGNYGLNDTAKVLIRGNYKEQ